MDIASFYSELDRLYAEGSRDQIETFLKSATDQVITCCGGFNPVNIAIQNELGSFYRGISKFDQSAEAFRMAGEMILRHIGKTTPEYATLLSNLGGTLRLMKKNGEALAAFLESMQIYQELGATEEYMYAAVLNNIALLHQDTAEYQTAADYLHKALQIIEPSADYRHDVATTYSNLAILHLHMGDKVSAEQCLQKATELFESLPGSQQIHYAAALNNLASFHYYNNDFTNASICYEKAAALTERFFGQNAEYATAMKNAAYAYEKQKNFTLAAERLEKAEAAYTRLFGQAHKEAVSAHHEKERLLTLAAEQK